MAVLSYEGALPIMGDPLVRDQEKQYVNLYSPDAAGTASGECGNSGYVYGGSSSSDGGDGGGSGFAVVGTDLSGVDNTPSFTLFWSNVAGSLLLVAVRYGADPGTLSDSRGNTYTQVLNNHDSVGWTRCWIASNIAAGANTLTLSNKAAIWAVVEYSGVEAVSPIDGSQVNGPSMGITTTESTELLVVVAGNGGQASQPTQVGSDYTPRKAWMGTYGGTTQGLAVYDRTSGAPGGYSISMNFMSPSGSQGLLMGLRTI